MADRQAPDAAPSQRLRAWLNDVQLSNRLGCPHYENPGQLKHDLSRLLDAVDAAEDYIFGARRAGDIAPYRRVQAAFKTIGLRSDPSGE